MLQQACAAAALFLMFMGVPAAQTDNLTGVIGLLALPQLAGRADCRQPPRREAPLHAAPGSADIVGWIRPDKDPNSDVNCDAVVLNVYRRDGSVRPLPTEEYEEEEPDAAIVVETRGRWFKLRLSDGVAWFQASSEDRYFSFEELLRRRDAYLTEAWDRTLAATAGGPGQRVPADARRRVIGFLEPVLEAQARAFERPDRAAPSVASFQTDVCQRFLRAASANPPKVVVFERRAGWFQVALLRDEWKVEPRAWIEDGGTWRFHAFETDAEREEFANDAFGPEVPSVRLVGSRVVAGALWLQIEMMSHTIYESVEPPRVIASGWVRAHDPAGQPVVWFYSRD